MDLRIGHGWDSHVFVPDRELRLGGVAIESTAGLKGHSDGDVLLHALCDALLGAIGAGDIGTHFPSSDPRWKDADSRQFVRHALNLVHRAGYSVVNLDATLIMAQPRLQLHREAILRGLADLLQLPTERLSIKGKTPEGLGWDTTAVAHVSVLLQRL